MVVRFKQRRFNASGGDAIHFEVVRFQVVVMPIHAAAGAIQVASVDGIGS